MGYRMEASTRRNIIRTAQAMIKGSILRHRDEIGMGLTPQFPAA
jgi:hypothetical protein